MHIFFSGIGGTGIAPLALVARDAGYQVSGSDKQDSQYITYLIKKGIQNIHIGQTKEQITKVHQKKPIDWIVYTSALTLENQDPEELQFAKKYNIKATKRDVLLNQILLDKNLKLIAVAGTHGKTTTTAMLVWLFRQQNIPLSYILPAKTIYSEMGNYDSQSQYLVYEADEFDNNFLAYTPDISVITGVSWDHQEIFNTREIYQKAFNDFIKQSHHTIIWRDDATYLGIFNKSEISDINILIPESSNLDSITLKGFYNRLDAKLAVTVISRVVANVILEDLIGTINNFPGLQRRMELIVPNLYSDYAHTPEKVKAAMSVALEMAQQNNQPIIVIYEPLTNRRQHYIMLEYRDCFKGAMQVYWLPSYLAREDQSQRIIPPYELISHLEDPSIAQPCELDDNLKRTIKAHLAKNDLVIAMAGGGGNSLDEWLRQEFQP